MPVLRILPSREDFDRVNITEGAVLRINQAKERTRTNLCRMSLVLNKCSDVDETVGKDEIV